jgi:tetratricopeptide (TPR) repeat protein
MKRKASYLIILLILAFNVQAQKFDKKQAYIDGHKHLQTKQYKQALDLFLLFEKNNASNANTDYLTGYCYFQLSETKKEAMPYLEKAIISINADYKEGQLKEESAPPLALFLLGQCYYRNHRFADALPVFEKYRDYVKNNPDEIKKLDSWVNFTSNAEKLVKTPVDIKIYNLGQEVNSAMDDHSAVFNIDESMMVFTSRRKGSTGNLKTSDGQYFEDIYVSNKKDNKWTEPRQISENINTMEHEASIALSPDGTELFIYKDDLGDGNIYVSKFDGTAWSKPAKLGSNINSPFNETHATISPDGTTLYFSSNRPEGYGGYDLYYVTRLPNGDWGWAQNLGPVVNTMYDETGPFMHHDGSTLYFSSKGFSSMGGYDLCFSILKDDGNFTRPENMGYPINTIDDDAFYVLSADGKRAYYSTKKQDSFGGKDIYLMDLLSLPERSLVVISGYLRDGSNEIIKDVVLTFTDLKTGKHIGNFKPNPNSGKYTIVVPKSMNYRIAAEDGSLVFKNNELIVPENSSFYYLQKPILIDPIAITK